MLKYVIILLDKTATAFCHADNPHTSSDPISVGTLHNAIFWAMTENLRIQFVYPDYELPKEILQEIDTIDHADIRHNAKADATVCNSLSELNENLSAASSLVLRIGREELMSNSDAIVAAASKCRHLSVVITDIAGMTQSDFTRYKATLSKSTQLIKDGFVNGKSLQLNLLTDRLILTEMNNCNAGWESVTIAPNGKFYICPAFYYENENDSVGDLENGLHISNPQLYRLDHAPICRNCDAFQCRRCVWLNRKTTLEVNTPSHEQCVVAHLERNASRELLLETRKSGEFLPGKEIPEIDYLDPFDKIINNE